MSLPRQAEGRARFDVTAETLGEALRVLPVADLLFDAWGEWRRHLLVYVDGEDVSGVASSAQFRTREIRIVGMISGG